MYLDYYELVVFPTRLSVGITCPRPGRVPSKLLGSQTATARHKQLVPPQLNAQLGNLLLICDFWEDPFSTESNIFLRLEILILCDYNRDS